jgi:hypothetical protein
MAKIVIKRGQEYFERCFFLKVSIPQVINTPTFATERFYGAFRKRW